MKRVVFITVIGIISLVAATVFASDLKKPRITAQDGQTKQQQKIDAQECREAAIDSTGIDPEILELRIRASKSMQGRAAMPGPLGGRTLSPSKYNEAKGYQNKIEAIKKEYGLYQQAFSETMGTRGYSVKW